MDQTTVITVGESTVVELDRPSIIMTMNSSVYWALVLFLISPLLFPIHSFTFSVRQLPRFPSRIPTILHETPPEEPNESDTGDPLRAATGIRPSLHPLTINILQQILKSSTLPETPLEKAHFATTTAMDALQKHATQEALTELEQQTVVGRVVGVTMRLDLLDELLYKKVQGTPWIAQYNDGTRFGQSDNDVNESNHLLVLLARAECYLALFLDTIERPQIQDKPDVIPDGSVIDFLEDDRYEVLCGGK